MKNNSSSKTISKIVLNNGAGIGACMDVKAHNGKLYAIQKACDSHRGRLTVVDSHLEVISYYEGIGNARQIEIINNVAYITAREDGLWIFDISGNVPKLLCQYRTVEFATGVALCGNLAFISCRQYGVEIIDIADPKKPKHIGIIRVGEVQSATVDNGILYCGVWGEMKVVVVDISTPAEPRVLSEIPLQGRGDGVCVLNGILYAATGQHARGIINVVDENDPAFSLGTGFAEDSSICSQHKIRFKLFYLDAEAFDILFPVRRKPVSPCGIPAAFAFGAEGPNYIQSEI